MFTMKKARWYVLVVYCTVFLGLVSFMNVHADTLENGLKEWDPSVIQGTIMDTGKNSIVVSEQWIMLIDSTVRGKHLETQIMDNKGSERSKGLLKKGTLVLAKGGLAWDERLKTNVLLATEIRVLDRPVNMNDEKIRKDLRESSRPW